MELNIPPQTSSGPNEQLALSELKSNQSNATYNNNGNIVTQKTQLITLKSLQQDLPETI